MLTLASALFLAVPQTSGGFLPGDLYLYSPSVPTSTGRGILRVDPVSGQTSVALELATTNSTSDTIEYDPYRDRLIFFGGLVLNQNRVWLMDAAGNLEDLGQVVVSGPTLGRFASRGDGIIYFRGFNAPLEISYFDAANQVQTLMDASGSAPYDFPGGANAIRHLVYHAPTNSLVAAISNNLGICPGGVNDAVNLWRIDLSSDGTRALSETCSQFNLQSGTFGEVVVGLAPGPGGDLLLHIDDNSPSLLPRMVRVEVATLTSTAFASSESPATSAGCYSQVLDRAIVLDSGFDELRAYANGQSGSGLTIATGVSGVGGSGEAASLVEIQPAGGPFGLAGAPSSASLSAGGSQAFALDLGASQAGALYLLAGSATGFAPPLFVDGIPVPLVLDGYSVLTLSQAGTASLPGSVGFLDAQGRAQASLVLAPGLTPSLAGVVLHHAALVFAPNLTVEQATNPVALTLVP